MIPARPPRRADREIPTAEAEALLTAGTYGVLSTVGSDGLPYAIPVSYTYRERVIYVHCAPEGRKLDNLAANPAVSFCVVGHTQTLPRHFSTEYESAIAAGTARLVDGDEKERALVALLEKYSPEFMAQGHKYIAGKIERVAVLRIDVEHVSGKARR
ncbi:pyridoxamine 5'-phosphate oxidase family protein [Rhodocyclus tenuis]|uniref:Pyridoxamine 5'-phosphate oxidase family protein n=2 Tax=Rhodocyclus TaxID=1064 RepID=A0A6L5JYA1_RHOTE|nr:pyridoxamine 5'-phosphate oxidase family protein [Rhodocyclus gracilis]MQY51812.1 pyridoxamine 5'-phosphate oxidase family protein [Rhodocyclus gracilis]MRD73499.1 pyridoxamine 5'-phosphate oxidase family protein [Rhodocyclus gracilis]NJA88391.1 pyridoxamine 5'-phosphate oxidase family protein [Rhodocyclus gracilis]